MRKIFAVMLAAAMVLGTTACGSSSGQTASEQAGITQTESIPETEAVEDTADGEEAASNILIAYFSRMGNMKLDRQMGNI